MSKTTFQGLFLKQHEAEKPCKIKRFRYFGGLKISILIDIIY